MKETFYGTHIIHIVCPALGASLANIIIYRGVALGMFLLCRSFVSSNYLLVLVLVVIRLAI